MIEFRLKQHYPNNYYPNNEVSEWEVIRDITGRTYHNFEFGYCDYRIGDDIYTAVSPEFIEALKKERFWIKLQQC